MYTEEPLWNKSDIKDTELILQFTTAATLINQAELSQIHKIRPARSLSKQQEEETVF